MAGEMRGAHAGVEPRESATGRAAGAPVAPRPRASTESAGACARWAPGSAILWRYRANTRHVPGLTDARAGFHICRPVTVVRDTPELLAVWLAPGTVCIKPVLADGTPLHRAPLAARYTRSRTTVRTTWQGTGVLKLALADEPWSVWLFWEPGWRFRNYYVNLEAPRTRWAGGVDSEDHFLDLSVRSDGTTELLDEDEFEAAQRAGLMGRAQRTQVRSALERARRAVAEWRPPFCDNWHRWRPQPDWPVPELPEDWDRAALAPERRSTALPPEPPRRPDPPPAPEAAPTTNAAGAEPDAQGTPFNIHPDRPQSAP